MEQARFARMFYRTFISQFSNSQQVFVDERHVKSTELRRRYGFDFKGALTFIKVVNSAHGEDELLVL